MTISKKQKLVIIISIVSAFVVGLLFGFLLGKNSAYRQLLYEKEFYKSSGSIYINTGNNYISSSDLSKEVELPDSVFDLENIYATIGHGEYRLTLESVENTQIYQLTVIGESKEHLQEICEEAMLILVDEINAKASGYSARVIDFSSEPVLMD